MTPAAGAGTVVSSTYSADGVTWATNTAAGWAFGPVNFLFSTGGGGGGGSSLPPIKFREMYSYSPAGLLLNKRLWAAADTAVAVTLDGSYTYDIEGRMVSQTYPSAQPVGGGADAPGETFTYGFDTMGRTDKMGTAGNATSWISGVTYNASGQPTAITTGNAQVAGETREYNVLGQLTRIVSGNFDFRYNFSATANDGRITSQSSYQGGTLQETVSYTYDSLNRLSTASAGATWSATYTYDRYTNLLGVASSGTGPVPSPMNVTVNAATNRRSDWSFDLNGNVTAKPVATLFGLPQI